MYEVTGNHGCVLMKDEDDAIGAFFLLSGYHDICFDRDKIERHLEKYGYYEDFPLVIKKCE